MIEERQLDDVAGRVIMPGDADYDSARAVMMGGIDRRNESGQPATILIHFAPGAPREAYFEGIPGMATATEDERAEFYRIHDNHWV